MYVCVYVCMCVCVCVEEENEAGMGRRNTMQPHRKKFVFCTKR